MRQRKLWSDKLTEADVLAVFTPADGQLDRTEICKRLGVSKNKNVIALIERLVADGQLDRTEDRTITGTLIYLYERR